MQYQRRPYSQAQPHPEPENPPPRVRAAIGFIGLCQEAWGPISYPVESSGALESNREFTEEFFYPERDPHQVESFRKACSCLGRYFDEDN